MHFFFRNCTHILTRTQGKKYEDMFLVKIASKGTFLRSVGLIDVFVQLLSFKMKKKTVLRIVRIGNFYNFPTSGILKYIPEGPRRSEIFRMSVNNEICLPGRSPTIRDFYDKYEHETCLSET